MTSDYGKFKNAYLVNDLSVTYALSSGDITKGEKPQGTDYITSGGFTTHGEEENFRIVHDFPKQTDSGLSRYVWIRYSDGVEFY